jgi:hypothetical protein
MVMMMVVVMMVMKSFWSRPITWSMEHVHRQRTMGVAKRRLLLFRFVMMVMVTTIH